MFLEFVRTVSFSAAHRYASSSLGEAESARVYGSLYRPAGSGFGHNFLVEATFAGPVSPSTGMIASLDDVDGWLRSVAARFDHRVLNELPEFSSSAPTLELIAREFFNSVSVLVSSDVRLVSIRLREGDSFWVDYFGEPAVR